MIPRTRLIPILLALAVATGLLGTSDAHATYPGANGRISFGRFDPSAGDFHIYAANRDGTHETQLTTTLSEGRTGLRTEAGSPTTSSIRAATSRSRPSSPPTRAP
jgi:hypothetical protein